MNEIMKDSFLIQRLKKPVGYNPHSFGGGCKNGGVNDEAMKEISEVFSFDYMGASEFEFGKLPKTLSRIVDDSSNFTSGSLTVHWETCGWRWEAKEIKKGQGKVYFICHKEQKEEVKKRIKGWAKGKSISGDTKCLVMLDVSFDEKYFHGWLELDNGFFFFIDKEMFENTKKLFEIK